MSPMCASCIYSDNSQSLGKPAEWLLCRRSSPVVLALPDPPDVLDGGWTTWPRVRLDDWCGEYISCGPARHTFLEEALLQTSNPSIRHPKNTKHRTPKHVEDRHTKGTRMV